MHICVGKAWGLKTTLPQTPHSAGSLRHWVRSFFFKYNWQYFIVKSHEKFVMQYAYHNLIKMLCVNVDLDF